MDDEELVARAVAVIRANVVGDLTEVVTVMAAGRSAVSVVGKGAAALIGLCNDAAQVLRPVADPDGRPRACTVFELTPWFASFVRDAGGRPARLGERHAWAVEPPTDDLLRDSGVARRAALEFVVRRHTVLVAAERSRLVAHALRVGGELDAVAGPGPAPALEPPGD